MAAGEEMCDQRDVLLLSREEAREVVDPVTRTGHTALSLCSAKLDVQANSSHARCKATAGSHSTSGTTPTCSQLVAVTALIDRAIGTVASS